MRALSVSHREMTRESLLQIADETPGAWIGIRIAAYLLILSGWKSSQIAELFGLTRRSVVNWIHKANRDGKNAVKDNVRPGRPSQFDERLKMELDEALSKSPKDYGIPRNRWDGGVVVEYLKRFHRITIHIRHAQRWIRNLDYSLKHPVYRFVQASKEGVEGFHKGLKKTSEGQKKQR